MITRQCGNCTALAEDLRIVRANNAQLCRDMDAVLEARDALAAQVEQLREVMNNSLRFLPKRHPVAEDLASALALPDQSTTILKQRDAKVLRRAAETFYDFEDILQLGHDAAAAQALGHMADEMEAGK